MQQKIARIVFLDTEYKLRFIIHIPAETIDDAKQKAKKMKLFTNCKVESVTLQWTINQQTKNKNG